MWHRLKSKERCTLVQQRLALPNCHLSRCQSYQSSRPPPSLQTVSWKAQCRTHLDRDKRKKGDNVRGVVRILCQDSLKKAVWLTKQRHSQSLARAMSEVFTANDSSMGSSGGTTEVRMRVHSRNSLYLFRLASLVPEKEKGIQTK